jgi:hypothetical protein
VSLTVHITIRGRAVSCSTYCPLLYLYGAPVSPCHPSSRTSPLTYRPRPAAVYRRNTWYLHFAHGVWSLSNWMYRSLIRPDRPALCTSNEGVLCGYRHPHPSFRLIIGWIREAYTTTKARIACHIRSIKRRQSPVKALPSDDTSQYHIPTDRLSEYAGERRFRAICVTSSSHRHRLEPVSENRVRKVHLWISHVTEFLDRDPSFRVKATLL